MGHEHCIICGIIVIRLLSKSLESISIPDCPRIARTSWSFIAFPVTKTRNDQRRSLSMHLVKRTEFVAGHL